MTLIRVLVCVNAFEAKHVIRGLKLREHLSRRRKRRSPRSKEKRKKTDDKSLIEIEDDDGTGYFSRNQSVGPDEVNKESEMVKSCK